MDPSGWHAHERSSSLDADDESRLLLRRPHEIWVLAGSPAERAVLLDQSGRPVVVEEGGAGQVMWTEAALRPLIGLTHLITHNHPARSSVGLDDFLFARFLDAREVDAVTPSLRFRLFRPGQQWPLQAEIEHVILPEREALIVEARRALNAGDTTDEQVNLAFYHSL